MATSTTRSDRKTELRDAQRRWLEQVIEHAKGLPGGRHGTPTGIARLSGIDDTTLTKFRNKAGYKGTLSALTIRQIADATGYPATSEALGEDPGAQTARGFREPEAEKYEPQPDDEIAPAIAALTVDKPWADAWTIRTRALEYEGFRPGDVLVVDLNAQPASGDIVCVQIYDWQLGVAETTFRIYYPPILIGAGPEEAARLPIQANDRSVAIKGVMIASFRRRTARAAA